MAAGTKAGGVYLDVDLETRGVGEKLSRQLQAPMVAAGDRVSRSFGSRLTSGLQIAGKAAALGLGAAGGAAVLAGKRFYGYSAELEAVRRKSATVFGSQLGVVDKWAKANANAMGLTSSEATGLAANFQDLLVPMGFTRKQATSMSTDVIGLSGALSQWSGGQRSSSEVADILAKAMLGERDALKGLGISISENDVTQRLAKNGTDKLTGAALEQAKAVATQQLIFEKSTDAQAAYRQGQTTLAGKQAVLTAKIKEQRDRIALALIPAFSAAADWTGKRLPGAIAIGERALAQMRVAALALAAGFRGTGASSVGFAGIMAGLGARARELAPQLQSAFDQVRHADFSPLLNGAKVAGPVLAFLADHIDSLVRAMPFLVGAFAAYKAAEAAANVVSLARIPIMAAQLGVNLRLSATQAALTRAIQGSALAYNSQAVAAGRAAVAGRGAAVAGGGAGRVGAAAPAARGGRIGAAGAGALGLVGGPAGLALAGGIALGTVAWASYTAAGNKAKDAVAGIVAATNAVDPRSLATSRSELEKIANAPKPSIWAEGAIPKIHAFNEGTKAARLALADLDRQAADNTARKLVNDAMLQGSAAARFEAAGFAALTAAQLASGTQSIAAAQANLTYKTSLDSTTAAVAQNGRTHNANTAAGRANQGALLGLVDAGKANLAALIAQNAPAAALTAAVGSQRTAFIKQATAMGYSKDEAGKLATSYGLIPPEVKTYIRTEGEAEVEATLARLSPLLRNAHYTQTTSILVSERGLAGGDPGLLHGTAPAHFAGGGRVAPNSVDLVGERGAELLTQGNRPAYVTKNSDLVKQVASALGERSSGYVDNSVMNNYTTNGISVAQLERYKRLQRLQHA